MTNAVKRFRFFKGQPVKRMRQGRYGIILTLVSAIKGEAGTQITITQQEWDEFGEWREFSDVRMSDMREIAAERG